MIALLNCLRLDNIALIDSLELSFEKGFTVFTGETGAGKSLLLDALDALLGGSNGQAGLRLVRPGVSQAHIEASFAPNVAVVKWLNDQDFDIEDSDLIISREWRKKDDRYTSRFRLNGISVNRNLILSLRPLLIDITAQGQTQEFTNLSKQRQWLDSLGADEIQALLLDVKKRWREWETVSLSLEQAISEFESIQQNFLEKKAFLEELDDQQLEDSQEIDKLTTDQDRLANLVKLQEGISLVLQRLSEDQNLVPTAFEHLKLSIKQLQSMAILDHSLNLPLQKCIALDLDLASLINDLQQYEFLLESEPLRLQEVQQRLDSLKRLEKRHGMSLADLIAQRNSLRDSLESLDCEDGIKLLEIEEYKARKNRDFANQKLTAKRKEIAKIFEDKVSKYLRSMALEHVRIEVLVDHCEPGILGADSVQVLFSANPGLPLAPLLEVASGGEMSRFLLALKASISSLDSPLTLLFDEIDAGVSGRVSSAIGCLLKDISSSHQVFCVTHQPLVAAAANHHFSVTKSVLNGVVRSSVSELTDINARQVELAELAGGDHVKAKHYAASLLDQHAA